MLTSCSMRTAACRWASCAYSNRGGDHWSDFRKLNEAPAQGERCVEQRRLIFHFALFSTSRPTATQVSEVYRKTRNSRVFNVSHIATQVYLQHPLWGDVSSLARARAQHGRVLTFPDTAQLRQDRHTVQANGTPVSELNSGARTVIVFSAALGYRPPGAPNSFSNAAWFASVQSAGAW